MQLNSITPGWRVLKRYGSSKAIISSYLWIVVVPIAAKLLPELNNFFSHTEIDISLGLPFSWELFYYAAISFSISSYIFSTHCPFINMKFDTPIDALDTGYGMNQLDSYFLDKTSKFKDHKRAELCKERYESISAGEDEYNDKFWIVHREFSKRRVGWRFICTMGYIIGFLFIGIILAQNFIYVWNH